MKAAIKFFTRKNDQEKLTRTLRSAEKANIIDHDALGMMESIIQVSELHARDIMVPRSQMVTIKEKNSLMDIIQKITKSGHSRFPVEGDDQEEILGILLAKDLLNLNQESFDLHNLLRPAVFVPESKRLNTLLKDFKENHNHMAIVADEYGGVAGLVTIEDVIEQIIGDIEDEHDLGEEHFIKKHSEKEYILKGTTPIEEFNKNFKTKFSDKEFDTIAGLVIKKLGYLPKHQEKIKLDKFEFTVLRADKRRVHLLLLKRL